MYNFLENIFGLFRRNLDESTEKKSDIKVSNIVPHGLKDIEPLVKIQDLIRTFPEDDSGEYTETELRIIHELLLTLTFTLNTITEKCNIPKKFLLGEVDYYYTHYCKEIEFSLKYECYDIACFISPKKIKLIENHNR
jgi:hypothetical protein